MSTVCLVELANRTQLLDKLGPRLEKQISEEFNRRLQQWLRPQDRGSLILSDRFCVIMHDLKGVGQIRLAAMQLENIFHEPIELLGQQHLLFVHAGFAIIDDNSDCEDTVLQQAASALATARQQQTIYSIYDASVALDQHKTPDLIHGLERALNQGEFNLYYQPKVHPTHQTIVGAEALIRWYKPDGSIVTPGAFMPIAESHAIIKPITWWVIKAAIARAKTWQNTIGVSVNIPPNLLLDAELNRVITDTLDIHDFAPNRLTLEVTESVMVSDQEHMFRQLTAFRDLGIRISIDDFGTGYSSFIYFRDLPADELKLDRTFVMAMEHSPKDKAIVKSVIELAHNFGLRVVAEGVETQTTADALSALKCDTLQGFHFDEPLTAQEFEQRYAQ